MGQHRAMPTYCRAKLNYFDGPAIAPTEVEILDGRRSGPLSWAENGFELVEHASKVEAWDAIDVDSVHYEEIGALAREFTGCDDVVYYEALLRSPETAAQSEDLAPVQLVHSDYTEGYWAMIQDDAHPYRKVLAPFMERAGVTGEDIRRARRVVTLQFWRNVGPTRMSHPLAFCDGRTVPRSLLTPVLVPEYGGVPTGFESFVVAAPSDPAEHRWYTFPAMNEREVVVFRAFDSDRVAAGEPFWTPHSAFADPTVPADAPARVSLEMRAVCLFYP